MDFNHQSNNPPSQVSRPITPSGVPEPFVPARAGKKRGDNKLRLKGRNGTAWALVLIAVVLIAFGLLWYFRSNGTNEISQVNNSEYQAIFLSNGQVYFGKLVTLNNNYAKVTHIFYLQVNQTVQPDQGSSSSNSQNQGAPTLVKLGSEIHGPEDAMMINRSQIEFWENLKPSGQVTQAIDRYYQSGGKTDNNSTPSNTTRGSSSATPTPSGSSNSTSTTTPPGSSSTKP